MPRVSYAFFTLAAVCGLIGMLRGIRMGMTQDFSAHPAHAHLSLVGWVSLAVMGGFYALERGASVRLAWINFILSGLGGTVLPFGIALVIAGHGALGAPLAIAGGMLAMFGMAAFLVSVLTGWRRIG